ncbi:family 10 glycosylhydrolase [Phormidium sp. CLA17]|uniref:glycoside hydrolase family 10 protein n=1 Tax=Leptolyngbya sp. Cla-17 TaxID=2803751 RepID=UPI0014912A2C|nr:family 10 glycosylhydrolase [Leptolyngbya sp. Cla-17]MBM0740567.1 family 10 glycosylhydrolase [Leptolyngbya sp. Cla-17]
MSKHYRWQSTVAWLVLPLTSLGSILTLQASAIAQVQGIDLQGHWAQQCMTALAGKKIVSPSQDGLFRPNAVVSRAEYAALVQRAFPAINQSQKPIAFRDVRPDNPNAKAIQYIQRSGFWLGEGRDEFRPGDWISRSQAFGGLAAGLRYTAKQPESKNLRAAFKDGRTVPDYTRAAVAAALENRLIINQPDPKRFNPNQPITRAELAAAVCQAMPSTTALVPMRFIATRFSPGEAAPTPKPLPPVAVKPGTGGGIVTPVGLPVVVVPVIGNPGTSRPPLPSLPRPSFPTQEIRGVWLTNIDSQVLFNPQLLRSAVEELGTLKFNTVYPVVWNWGYTLYPSQVMRQVTGAAIDPREPGLRGRDPLAELVQLGRQNKIAIMPWFEFGFMAPADSELVRRNPKWLTQRKDGSKVWREGEYDRVWLNPFKPEVQQFILNLVDEIVSKYDVDGIQFDDHMGLPSEFGYDDYTIELYKKENPGKEPPVNAKDPQWLRWRANKITEFMGRVFALVKARKPYATVSLSPNSQIFSYENYLQDWSTWRRLGYVEEILLQAYRTDPTGFISELAQAEVQEAKKHVPVAIGVLTGLKNKPMPMSIIEQKIQIARDRGFSGMSFFFYETMWNLSNEPSQERKSSFQMLFAPTVTRPNLVRGWVPPATLP